MSEIDWNVELRKIEREFEGLAPEPSPAQLRTQRAAELRARERHEGRIALLGAWSRLGLVATLTASLNWWPYAHDCGLELAGLLIAETMVIVGGLWVAACTWRRRLAWPHGGAMVLVIVGLTLVAAQLLPRVGYATIAHAHAEQWLCRGSS